MHMLRSALRVALAASLAVSPVVASAQVAGPASAVAAPESVDDGSSQLAGDYSPLIAIGLLVLVIITAFVLEDDPASSP